MKKSFKLIEPSFTDLHFGARCTVGGVGLGNPWRLFHSLVVQGAHAFRGQVCRPLLAFLPGFFRLSLGTVCCPAPAGVEFHFLRGGGVGFRSPEKALGSALVARWSLCAAI